MSDAQDWDIVRPLGLVTLYSGYAELEIDELLDVLSTVGGIGDQANTWPVGKKIAFSREVLIGLKSEALAKMIQKLDEAKTLFDRRNALVHSAIFCSTDVVVSRTTGREQKVTPGNLTDLAHEIFNVKEYISANRQRVLEPFLASIQKREECQ